MVHVPLWSQPVLEHLCRLPCALRRLHLQCVLHQSPMQCWLPEWWSSILIKQGDLSPVSCLQCHHQMSLPCTHTWVLSSRLLHPELISEKILQQIYFLCWLILWSLKKKKVIHARLQSSLARQPICETYDQIQISVCPVTKPKLVGSQLTSKSYNETCVITLGCTMNVSKCQQLVKSCCIIVESWEMQSPESFRELKSFILQLHESVHIRTVVQTSEKRQGQSYRNYKFNQAACT